MAGLVDREAQLLDFRAALAARESWGRRQILDLLDELEQAHRIEETADEAVLRRFAGHLTDTFFDVAPRPAAPGAPLTTTDPAGAARVMDDGAASHHHTEGSACPRPTKLPSTPGQDRPVSRRVATLPTRPRAAART